MNSIYIGLGNAKLINHLKCIFNKNDLLKTMYFRI